MRTSTERIALLASRDDNEIKQFEELLAGSKKRAYSRAFELTHNPSEAEDLLQDTFVKAWKGYGSYMPGRPFLNWLLRIMQHAYLDNRRRDNPIRRAESLTSMISPSDGEVQELPIPDTDLTPEEQYFQQERKSKLGEALEELPSVYRQAIVACDMEGMSYGEIADMQKTTVGTVRSRIHRGRKMLRESLVQKGIVRKGNF